MAKRQFDVAVIGSGPGGYIAALRCAQLGMKTACIEKSIPLGGTCLNVGCIPSKALLNSSEHYLWLHSESALHGINIKEATFDFGIMQSRKQKVVEGLTNGVASLFKKHSVTRVIGSAKFSSANLLEVVNGKEKQVVEAENIIIATGSIPVALPFLPFDEDKVVSSTGALALLKVPKKMLVVGAGVIGVELASVYQRLGAEVVLIEMLDRICFPMDTAISKSLQQILTKQGLKFHLSTKVKHGGAGTTGIKLTIQNEQGDQEISGDIAIVAIGRRPYTEDLGLKPFGIQTNSKGFITVDGNFRTTLDHVYAIGDVIEGPMLAHKASEEGVAVAEILAGLKPHINYMAIPNVVYTSPEAASVGMTESEAREARLPVKIGVCSLRALARARAIGESEGFIKIIGEENTGRVIGLHILAPQASEMIAEGVIAIEKKATLLDIATASHAHPTLSEGVKEAALNALGRALAF